MMALQAKYDALQDKHELHKNKSSDEEARRRDEVAALQQINHDLRSDTVSQIDSAYARLQMELSLLASTDAVRKAELARSAESIGALCDDKRQLGVELANALSAKLSAESALTNLTVLASDEEAHFREQIATLSSQIIDLTSGLASERWQSAAEEQLARDRIKEIEKDKQTLSLDLHKARAQAAREHSQLSITLFVLSSKHDRLKVELENERLFKQSVAAIEERLAFAVEQMNKKMLVDEENTLLTVRSMQDKLDAAHAEATASEREKQELTAAHSEKLGDMKNLVTTFTERLKEAREKEVTHTAEAHDQSCRVTSISEELSDLRSRYHSLESAAEAETARARAAADSEDRTAKDTIAALAAKIEGLTASAKSASTQLALRETSSTEEIDALHAQVASLQLNLDLSKAAVAQTQSAAELELHKVRSLSAAAEAAVWTELAVLSATHRSLTAQLQKAEVQAAGDVAKAEDHAATLSGKIDGLQAEVHSGREVTAALMCGMHSQLDAAHAEATASEREKQELTAAHSEKLGDMKNLVTTFTERLKEAREKEVTHDASAAEMHGLALVSNLNVEEKCVELMAMKSELAALESSVLQERYARLTELQSL